MKRPKAVRKAIIKPTVTSLAEAGGLPPASDDDEVIGDDGVVARDVEVMSEPPEIDTTRFDGPPRPRVCGVALHPAAARILFVLMVLLLIPAAALALCLLLRQPEWRSPRVEAVYSMLVNKTLALEIVKPF